MCILVWSTITYSYKAKRDQLSVEEIVGTGETSIYPYRVENIDYCIVYFFI